MNTEFKNRLEWLQLIKELIPVGVGVEVGSFNGDFAKDILTRWNGKLYLVDVWRALGEEYNDASNMKDHADAYFDTMKNIDGFEDRAIMIRATSEQAVQLFADESLDFIYIDANHAYDFVKQDLEMWFPKLKPGGIFSGHDYLGLDWYNDPNFCPNGKDKYIWVDMPNGQPQKYIGMYGVVPAVDEFCKEHNYKVNKTGEWFGTWWFVK